jgi:hypothetical protein
MITQLLEDYMMQNDTIISVHFEHEHFLGHIAHTKVRCVLHGGHRVELFDYYADELTFTASELIGLTPEQARTLRFKKDVAYLKSA